ncbi:MAG TPA: hypothetical protein VIN09_12265 [Chloroflexota bacterium]
MTWHLTTPPPACARLLRRLLALAAVVLVACQPAAAPVPSPREAHGAPAIEGSPSPPARIRLALPRVWLVVASQEAQQIVVARPDTGEIVRTVDLDVPPSDLVADPGGRFVLVSSSHPESRAVLRIDLESGATTAWAGTPGPVKRLVASPSTNRLFALLDTTDALVAYDATDPSKALLVPIERFPTDVVVAHRDDPPRLYVGGAGDDTLGVFDAKTLQPLARIPVGQTAALLALDEAGTTLYIADGDSRRMTVVDPRERVVRHTLELPERPGAIAHRPSEPEVWVAGRSPASAIWVLDGSDAAVEATIPVEGDPTAIAFTPDGSFAFVASRHSTHVTVVDATTRRPVETIDVGVPPHRLALTVDATMADQTTPTVEAAAPATSLGTATPSSTAKPTVRIALREWAVALDQEALPRGATRLHITNAGSVIHAVRIVGQGTELQSPLLRPGDSVTMEVDLSPGAYELYCPLSGHRDLGLRTSVTVR